MAAEALNPFLKGDSGRNTRGLLRIIILCTIAGAAVASRLFSVIRKSRASTAIRKILRTMLAGFESIIHECQSPYLLPKVYPSKVHH